MPNIVWIDVETTGIEARYYADHLKRCREFLAGDN